MFKKIKNKKGFTLTELIVVIVIIGILAAVLIPSLTGYITKAKKSADEQKVASLNTLLIEAQVNEMKFNDVIELKDYLEDEMGYNGDYSLKVEGSYMWYDSVKRKIVIITEDDEPTLKKLSATDTPKFVTSGNLKSPEGLMQYSSGDEVWLIGGNGYLVNLVEEIRNIGNSGELNEYTNLSDGSKVKEVLKKFFEVVVFSGTQGTYSVQSDGTVKEVTEKTTSKKEIKASQESNLAEIFHKEVIEKNIPIINEKLKKDNAPVELVLNDHTVTIKITKSNGLTNAANAVYEVIKLLKDNGCKSGWVFPKRYEMLSEYEKVLEKIFEGYKNYSSEKENTITKELYKYLDSAFSEKENEFSIMEQFYKVDLSKIESSDLNGLISNFLPIIVALNLEEENNEGKTVYDFNISETNLSVDLFKEKEPIRLIGKIESEKYGRLNAQYDFVFDTSSIDKDNN